MMPKQPTVRECQARPSRHGGMGAWGDDTSSTVGSYTSHPFAMRLRKDGAPGRFWLSFRVRFVAS
jgi:hypothetical protein